MSDISASARLTLALEGMHEAIRDLGKIADEIDGGSAILDKFTKNANEADRAVKSMGDSAASAGAATRKGASDAKVAADGWNEYAKALKRAQDAHALAAQRDVVSTASPVPAKSASAMTPQERQDLLAAADARSASVVADARKIEQQQAEARKAAMQGIEDVATAERRLQAVQQERASKEAAEEYRLIEIRQRSIQQAREKLKLEAEAAAKAKRDAQGGRDYANASTISDHSIAKREAEGRQFSASLQARMQADADAMNKAADAASPRLRYALYDVAASAGVVGAAFSGATVGAIAMAGSFESAFTAVERTTGVTGDQVGHLREELIGLTRDMPLAFDQIADIAARGAQLDVPVERLEDFTRVVAQFVATSDTVTLDQAVEAFGRISELMGDTDFERISSAITQVGVASAATEGQIVKTTQELAPFGVAVGMSTADVVGLASAVASLGQPPERARSAFLTLQATVDKAVSGMNDKLGSFAQYLGMSEQATAELWKSDPTMFIVKLTEALATTQDITKAFDDLGLTEKRATQVFSALAGNVQKMGVGGSVLAKSLNEANDGYASGTTAAEQYAKVVDDLVSQWKIFQNAIQEAMATAGATVAPFAAAILPLVTKLIQGFSTMAKTPWGAVLVGGMVAGTALVGVLALLVAGLATAAASTAALRMAMTELGLGAVYAQGGLRGVIAALFGVSGAAGTASTGLRVMRIALASTGIGLAVVALGSLVGMFMEMGNAAADVDPQLKMMGDSLRAAMLKDAGDPEQAASGIKRLSTSVAEVADESDNAASKTREFVGAQSDVKRVTGESTGAIEEQTLAIGKNSDAWYRKWLSEQEGIVKVANDPALQQAATELGLSFDAFVQQGLNQAGGFQAYADELKRKSLELIGELGADPNGDNKELVDAISRYQELAAKIEAVAPQMDGFRKSAVEAQNTATLLGLAADDAGDGMLDLGDNAKDVSDSLLEAEKSMLDLENKAYSLGSTLGENAGMWDMFSEGGRQNLGALYEMMDMIAQNAGGDAGVIEANWTALYNALIEGGVATADQLSFLKTKIDELKLSAIQAMPSTLFGVGSMGVVAKAAATAAISMQKPAKAATMSFDNLYSGIESGAAKAAKAAGSGARETKEAVQSLADYANDLSSVMKRAFDLQFGADQAQDKISAGWNKMADAIAKSKQELADYQEKLAQYRADMASLAADKAIKQYWLTVAENYGDTLRAGKLRAELAEIDNKQTDAQKKLGDAQAKVNKSLSGNSDAAIQNRADLLGLVGSYQEYLTALASSGMSQDELNRKSQALRAEFVQQATRMGFSRGEVEKYARAFDEMGTVIRNMPRDITVRFDGAGAITAINEWRAKAQSALNAGGGLSVGSSFDGSGAAKMARAAALQVELSRLSAQYAAIAAVTGGLGGLNLLPRITEIKNALNSGNYWTGGYTGDGGKREYAGSVHKGEFVWSQEATRTVGVNNLAAAHSMAKQGKTPTMGGGLGPGVVELSAYDRQLLADIADRVGITIGASVLQANVNGSNANAALRRSA